MFQLGRELKRLLRAESLFSAPRDGLADGDPGLTELLNLDMLRMEGRAADIAAGRISARDRPMLQLRQAMVWREIARRTGEETALRKAAAAAESALKGLDRKVRADAFAKVRTEQAALAMLAVDLGGDEGLSAAAAVALAEAAQAAPRSPLAAVIQPLQAQIAGAEALLRGEAQAALTAAAECDAALGVLERDQRERPGRRKAALARLPAYEPVSWSRATVLRGEILTAIGEVTGDAGSLDRAVSLLASVFEHLLRDHSPLDWAAGQYRLGRALASLAEAAVKPELLEQARSAFDRALVVLSRTPAHPMRAMAAQAKAGALIRQAELLDDRLALDAAEAAFRCELAASDPARDPVAWAVCQVSLAQVYLSRLAMTGQDRGERARAAVALDAALEVFSEHGLRSLALVANSNLEQLGADV